MGAVSPPLGWRSPIYGRRVECGVIRRRYEGRLPASFDTTIAFGEGGPDDGEKAALIALWREWADDA